MPDDATRAFGRSLARLRARRGWTILQLACESATSNATIGRTEGGRNPTLATAHAIAVALDTTIDAMTWEDDLHLPPDDVHVDWHMTPDEWAQVREALMDSSSLPYIRALLAAGKLKAARRG